jgi:hypothetical protein
VNFCKKPLLAISKDAVFKVQVSKILLFVFLSEGSCTLAMFVHDNACNINFFTCLSGKTQIGSFLFCGVPPKVAKASTMVTVVCHCCWCYHAKTLPVEIQFY